MRAVLRFAPATILALSAAAALAQAPIIYPAKGQSAEQQQKDLGECAAWAKQTTGIDPAAVAATPAPAAAPTPAEKESSGPKGERLRGAARGAAAGAITGEIVNDDASEGAKAGAAVGVLAGGSRSRQNRKAEEKQAAQEQEQAQKAAQDQAEAQKQQQIDTYNRANAACMEGRGYTLK